jgi:growth factor-regulated tyrosine kinase substrate
LGQGVPTSTPSTVNAAPTNSSNEDDDIMRAIELSLKEANSRPGFTAPSARQTTQPSQNTSAQEDDDDADLLAAIQASLKEASISDQGNASQKQDQPTSNYTAYTYSTQPEVRFALSLAAGSVTCCLLFDGR